MQVERDSSHHLSEAARFPLLEYFPKEYRGWDYDFVGPK